MNQLKNYVCGAWQAGAGRGRVLTSALTGEKIAECSTEGLDFGKILDYGRTVGGPALRKLTFHQRAALLKQAAVALNERLQDFYPIAATYGATKVDAWIDVEGGLANLFAYSSLGKRQLPDAGFLTDEATTPLSKGGTFAGRHIMVPLEGVAVQINAYNFPSWGMLEKFAVSFLAGMPSVVKPATNTAWLAHRMVEVLVEANVLPEGTLQLVCGSVGDLLDHLTCQDVVCFTGSAETANRIKVHPTVVKNAVRVNAEADSLNCIVLGEDAAPGTPTFDLFVKEIVKEMTVKAGQKCTAIRRALVPEAHVGAAIEALRARLGKITVGDPAAEGVRMGPLVDLAAREEARRNVARLAEEAEIVFGDPNRAEGFVGGDGEKGAFMEPVLLHCPDPEAATAVHEVEAFGPVATVMGYRDRDQAVRLARRGGGSLAASVYTEDDEIASALAFGLAPYHGRVNVMNEKAAPESTGHGSAMPQMVHGGPGRAGGGEELGGLKGLRLYMQTTALQGTPERLDALVKPAAK
jgi:oxepin-CoA hydrolase/3-oxo-5,6-dehydrosuberyl-CoA semialdehyde dehydrogenase